MERVPFHDREMGISIQYHVMLIRRSRRKPGARVTNSALAFPYIRIMRSYIAQWHRGMKSRPPFWICANEETTHTQQTNKAFNMASTNCTIRKRQSKTNNVFTSLFDRNNNNMALDIGRISLLCACASMKLVIG